MSTASASNATAAILRRGSRPLWTRLLPMPLLMVVVSCATLSPDEATLHEAKALAFLMETNEFASTHVGYGGTPSEQVIAFHAVLHSARAATLFQSLVERAHPVGKLYGLCGLYLTDRHAFERAVQAFLTSNERVATQTSATWARTPLRKSLPVQVRYDLPSLLIQGS